MWFSCTPTDLTFFESAPRRLVHHVVLHAPPARVFDVLADEFTWRHWFAGLRGARWEGEPGPGAARVVDLAPPLSVRERFIAWEPGERFAFTIEAMSLPGVRSMAEDYRLEDLGDGTTELTWVAAFAPQAVTGPAWPLVAPVLNKMFGSAARGLAKYIDTEAREASGQPALA